MSEGKWDYSIQGSQNIVNRLNRGLDSRMFDRYMARSHRYRQGINALGALGALAAAGYAYWNRPSFKYKGPRSRPVRGRRIFPLRRKNKRYRY